MIKANITINLYSLDELNENAKRKAIEEHRNFLLSEMQVSDFEGCGDPELDTPESMYNEEYDYILMNDEGVIDSIETNDYLFFENGEMANTTQYCGKHPLAGETHLKIAGHYYKIA